jgi:hypothetical protein
MKAQVICIEGRWKDDNQAFERRCLVMPKGASDSMRDEILDDVGKGIFYVFDEDERILGEHIDFVVDFKNPISEIELGELQ